MWKDLFVIFVVFLIRVFRNSVLIYMSDFKIWLLDIKFMYMGVEIGSDEYRLLRIVI